MLTAKSRSHTYGNKFHRLRVKILKFPHYGVIIKRFWNKNLRKVLHEVHDVRNFAILIPDILKEFRNGSLRVLFQTPFQKINSARPDCLPGSSGRGGRTTNQAGSALNGRGFGGDCARSHTGRGGGCWVQGEQAGGKHRLDFSACSLWQALQQRSHGVAPVSRAQQPYRRSRFSLCLRLVSPEPSPPRRPFGLCRPGLFLRSRCRVCANPAPEPFERPLRCAGRLPPGSG